jgi:hypothetical protein
MNDTTTNDLDDKLSDAQEVALGLHKLKRRLDTNDCDLAEFECRSAKIWAFAQSLGLTAEEVNKALNDL